MRAWMLYLVVIAVVTVVVILPALHAVVQAAYALRGR